ncbi:thiamine-phosphate kinase [Tautonia plasticadhaerens]|uniref:Thiamine-monophosphate kinase n=1 Tax=Tautonia plasticadhaerens TaxID=2527974 RepID=A0A518H767_9BACT|nr:thiamine-phosphate kinase [Tautonia plasticadhaerens]QDV36672.1 Thiamine-monophosphate kinase [Tautonia plasticadhaerens]
MTAPGGPLGEFELIRRIRGMAPAHPSVALGIGDDAAVLRPPPAGSSTVVTTDLLLDGRHFLLDECGPEAAGYKSLAVNLSDVAAMAARPVAAFVAVALPKRSAEEIAEGLMAGMAPLANRFSLALAGGDTNAWDGPLVVCVTVIGEASPPAPVLRSGARPGDVVLVTGPLGGSILGRHLRPEPRVAEALALLEAAELHALIDLSDGLASDLGHVLDESGGLGASLDAHSIPIHPDAERLASRSGRSPLDHALGDGEDFELCLVVPPESAASLLRSPPPGVTLHRVGEIEPGPGIRLRDRDGSTAPVRVRGFDHLGAGGEAGGHAG